MSEPLPTYAQMNRIAHEQKDRDERIIALLERIADAIESEAEGSDRARAIHLWSIGQGRHPDD